MQKKKKKAGFKRLAEEYKPRTATRWGKTQK